MRAPQWRARKRPRLTIKNGQTRGAWEAAKTSGQRRPSASVQTWLNVRRVSAAQKKMATNSLLSHQKITNKRSCTRQQHVSNWSVQPAQKKRAAQVARWLSPRTASFTSVDSEDKARIVFVYGGVKRCQIGSNLRSHKEECVRSTGNGKCAGIGSDN